MTLGSNKNLLITPGKYAMSRIKETEWVRCITSYTFFANFFKPSSKGGRRYS